MTDKELCGIAASLCARAYAPYSRFQVGAALLCRDGSVFTGCNIENAAFGPGVCAERVAFFKALSEGHRDFFVLAVAGGKEGKITGFCPPCGVCRQVLREFCEDDFSILLAGKDGAIRETTLGKLLPESFGPDFVK